jgi:hypothetical protein
MPLAAESASTMLHGGPNVINELRAQKATRLSQVGSRFPPFPNSHLLCDQLSGRILYFCVKTAILGLGGARREGEC